MTQYYFMVNQKCRYFTTSGLGGICYFLTSYAIKLHCFYRTFRQTGRKMCRKGAQKLYKIIVEMAGMQLMLKFVSYLRHELPV
jgi:hypothetical protein